jgi:hypothetical protein
MITESGYCISDDGTASGNSGYVTCPDGTLAASSDECGNTGDDCQPQYNMNGQCIACCD